MQSSFLSFQFLLVLDGPSPSAGLLVVAVAVVVDAVQGSAKERKNLLIKRAEKLPLYPYLNLSSPSVMTD